MFWGGIRVKAFNTYKVLFKCLFISIILLIPATNVFCLVDIDSPSSLKATIKSDTKIYLTWQDNSDNETSFKIERKIDSGSFTVIASISSNREYYYDYDVTSGHVYAYRVRAYSSSGNTDSYSNESKCIILVPDALEVTTISSSEIELTWSYLNTVPTDAKTIIERRKSGSSSWKRIGIVDASITNYTDLNLEPDTKYYYRLRSKQDTFTSDLTYPNNSSGYSDKTYLQTPTGFFGYASDIDEISLKWDNVSDEDEYIIERKSETDDSFEEVDSVDDNTTHWADDSVSSDASYTYRIKAKSSDNLSLYSEEIIVAAIEISDPTNIESSTINSSKISLSWMDNSDSESNFEVWRYEGGSDLGWENYMVLDADTTYFIDDNLSYDTTYYYKIRAVNYSDSSFSPFSSTLIYESLISSAPTDLDAVVFSNTSVKLTWEDNSNNETSFKLEQKEGLNGTWNEIKDLDKNTISYTINSLTLNESYYFRVASYIASNSSKSYSEEIEIVTGLPNAPYLQSLDNSQLAKVVISWIDNSNNETGFYIEKKFEDGDFVQIAKVNKNVNQYTYSGLINNSKYTFRIRAYNGSGLSDCSNEKSFISMASISFTDIDSVPWAVDSINNLANKGILNGKNGNMFYPNDNITRAEFLSFVMKAFKLDALPVGYFEDVHSSDWFYKEVMTGKIYGIISGDNNNKFYPNKPITREDMAVIVTRTLDVLDKTLPGHLDSVLNKFSDKKLISSYALSSLAALNGEGLFNGRTTSSLAPKDTATRAEAVVLIDKVLEKVE